MHIFQFQVLPPIGGKKFRAVNVDRNVRGFYLSDAVNNKYRQDLHQRNDLCRMPEEIGLGSEKFGVLLH